MKRKNKTVIYRDVMDYSKEEWEEHEKQMKRLDRLSDVALVLATISAVVTMFKGVLF